MTIATPTLSMTAYADVTTVITSDVLYPASGEWGIDGNDPESRMANTGILEFDLDNYTLSGKYQFGHTNCMAGWKEGTPVELAFVFDGETIVFRRYVDKCSVIGERKERVHVIAVDWFEFAANHPLINPDLLEEATGDEGITEITTNMPIPPQSTDLDVGSIIHPTLLDTVSRTSRGYTELSKITFSELGYTYLQQPEILRFENFMSRNGARSLTTIPVHSSDLESITDESLSVITDEDSDPILADESESVSITGTDILRWVDEEGENVINTFSSVVHPRRIDTESIILHEPEKPIYISSGERKIFREFFIDPVNKRAINALPPTADPYTKSLLHFDGSTGHVTSFDDATGRIVWTAIDVEIVSDVFGTAPKFGSGAAYMDGSTSYIQAQDSPDFDLGSDSFTVDWWEYRFNSTSGRTSVNRDGTIATPPYKFGRSDGASLLVDISSDSVTNDIANGKTMGAITTGQFVHLAVVRSGNTFYTFKNGVQQDTWTSSGVIHASSASFHIGRNQSTYFDGVIDEFRFIKGQAVWTADFTPPTEPYELVGTFLTAWSNEDGTGTEFTADAVITIDYGTNGAIYDTANNSATSGYLFLSTQGYGIHLDSPVEDTQEDAASITAHGDKTASIDLAYHQEGYYGTLEGQRVVEAEKDSRVVLHEIEMHANKSIQSMMRFLHIDIGSLIAAVVSKIDKDAWFYVQRVKFRINNNRDIVYNWLLREAATLNKGLDDLAVEFAGTGGTDAVNFGHLPHVYSDDTPETLTFSFWFRPQTFATGALRNVVCGFSSDSGGIRFEYHPDTDDNLRLYHNIFSTSPGVWEVNTASSINTTYHVLCEINISSSGNAPVIYINGSSAAITLITAAAGTKSSKKGVPLVIGNLKTATVDYAWGFDGKVWDFRVFHDIDTSRATTIHNAGTYSPIVGNTGQVFQAFAVNSSRYASYQDLTLTSTKRLLDAHLLFVGTPNGSPIARVP